MNIRFSVLFSFLLTSHVQAKPPKKFLVCLGQEEAYIHKHKLGGAYSKLNQDIISALVQLGDHIFLKPIYEKKVCAEKFPSVEILKLLLTEKESPFYSNNRRGSVKALAVDKNSIKELSAKSIHIFIDFVNGVQTQMKDAHCLQKQIPELKTFFYKMQHTVEEVGMKQIFDEIKNIDQVFKKIKNLNFKKGC